MTELRQLVYTAQMAIRWRDMDAFGHVNSREYFTYFEQARILWWQETGLADKHLALKQNATGPVVVTAECAYLKQIVYPAELVVNVYAGQPGRSSYMLYYEIYVSGDTNTVYAKGSTKIVWVDYAAQRSVELPEWVRGRLVEK